MRFRSPRRNRPDSRPKAATRPLGPVKTHHWTRMTTLECRETQAGSLRSARARRSASTRLAMVPNDTRSQHPAKADMSSNVQDPGRSAYHWNSAVAHGSDGRQREPTGGHVASAAATGAVTSWLGETLAVEDSNTSITRRRVRRWSERSQETGWASRRDDQTALPYTRLCWTQLNPTRMQRLRH